MDYFTFPNTIKVLQRPSLWNFLKERRVVLVSASPGCGKSTTVASFINYHKLDFCWINLDEKIDATDKFKNILSSGLESSFPNSSGEDSLRASKKRTSGELIEKYFRQAALQHSKENPYCIVLDNFERTNANPEIQTETERLCLAAGEEIRIIIISREEIKNPFRRIRSNKELLDIRTGDFTFHQEEIKELFSNTYEIKLSENDYDNIYRITGGWITAVSFLAERLYHQTAEQRRITLDTFYLNKHLPEIQDYLENDVLKVLDSNEKKLLVYLNKAGNITPEIVEEFAPSKGKSLLSTLEKKNLFIQFKDPGLYVYQFQPYFNEFLNREYNELSSTEKKRALHIICNYLEKQNKSYTAIQLLLEGGDLDKAFVYLGEYSEELLQTGEYDRIRELLLHFSDEEIEENLLLSYYKGISISIINPDESQKILMTLLPKIQNNRDYNREAKLYSVLLNSYFFYQTSGSAVKEVVQMASEFLEENKSKISVDQYEILFALLPLGKWWISPAKQEAFEAALRAEEISQRFNNKEAFLCARLVLIRIYLEKAELNQAMKLLSKTETLLKSTQEYSHFKYYRTLLCFYKGDILFDMGELSRAIDEVRKGLSYAPKDFAFRPYLHLNLIFYNLFLENIGEAEKLYNETEREAFGKNEYLELYFSYFFNMLIAYRNKNKRRAEYYCRRLLAPENRKLLETDYPYTIIALAEILIYTDNLQEAEEFLENLISKLTMEDQSHSVASVLGLSAFLEAKKDNHKKAVLKAEEMEVILKKWDYQNIDICDPVILSEINGLTGKEPLKSFPRLLIEKEQIPAEQKRKPLEITTLGQFQVFINGQEISSTLLSGQKRVMDLLKFLIVYRKNGVMKERIYELFWPRYSYKSARDNLNTIIYRLRKILGDAEDYLITDVNNIKFNPETTIIDVDIFLELMSKAQKEDSTNNFEKAMNIYRESIGVYEGDFLEGDLYYDFIRDERENLQSKYRAGLFRMVQLSLNSGEYSEALEWAKKLIESDPLCEAAYRLLMICSSFVGSRSEIPRLYDKLNKKLQTYYKIQADEKTTALKDRLIAGEIPREKVWMEETII